MDNILDDDNNQKLSIFSAHDTTIKVTWGNLFTSDFIKSKVQKAFNEQNFESYKFLDPPFASLLIFELHYLNNEYYVKIFFNGKVLDNENFLRYLNVELEDGDIFENMVIYSKFHELLKSKISPNYCKIKCVKEEEN